MEHSTEEKSEKDNHGKDVKGHWGDVDKEIKILIATISSLALAALIFFAGMVVGRMQDRFVMRRSSSAIFMSGNNTMMPSPYSSPGMIGQGFGGNNFFANSNGTKGIITSVSGNNISITSSNGTNGIVTITPNTVIKNGSQDITISDLKKGEDVIMIGDPDAAGNITARFIGVQQ